MQNEEEFFLGSTRKILKYYLFCVLLVLFICYLLVKKMKTNAFLIIFLKEKIVSNKRNQTIKQLINNGNR